MKKVLIIKTSPRKGGNSDQLAEQFAKGAREAGHEVEEVTLADKEIHFCKGCLACVKTLRCVQKDDAVEICAKMREAEVIVWATPIYYYSISGQMKTMIDRGIPLYGDDYKFREVYLLSTAAEDEPTTVAGARTALQGWVDCFEKATFKGEVFVGGVTMPQDISGHVGLQQAYELGKNYRYWKQKFCQTPGEEKPSALLTPICVSNQTAPVSPSTSDGISMLFPNGVRVFCAANMEKAAIRLINQYTGSHVLSE